MARGGLEPFDPAFQLAVAGAGDGGAHAVELFLGLVDDTGDAVLLELVDALDILVGERVEPESGEMQRHGDHAIDHRLEEAGALGREGGKKDPETGQGRGDDLARDRGAARDLALFERRARP